MRIVFRRRADRTAIGVGSLVLAFSFALGISAAGAADRPTISGTAAVGQVLTSSSVGDSGVYHWEGCDPATANCADAPAHDGNWTQATGGNSQTYTVGEADQGHYLRVVAKGTSTGEKFASSAPVGPVPGLQVLGAQAGGLEPDHGNDFLISNDGTGPVLIKLPGKKKYVPVQNLREVPFGSIVKAEGVATIVSENGDGVDDTAKFWGGTFKALQSPDSTSYFIAKLRSKLHCGDGNKGESAKASSLLAVAAGGGRLWGSGHGKFRSRGRGGAATLRGTTWWWRDRCNGTQFGVTDGTGIDVRDPGHKGLVFLQPGDTYFAEI